METGEPMAMTASAAGPAPASGVREAEDQRTRQLAAVYSAHARGYAEIWSPVIHPVAARLLETLPWAGVGRVLDVGTGAGGHLQHLRRLAPRATILGIDRAPGMLAIARDHAIPLALMDAMALGIRDRSIDVAVMAFVLFHVREPVGALTEVRRALRPGGLVAVTTWAEDPEVEAARVWEAELDAHGAVDPMPLPPSRHDRTDTPDKVAGLFSAAGLAPARAWLEPLVYRWDLERLTALRTRYGRTKRKLESLDADTRAAFLVRARERLTSLPPEAFVYRARVVAAVARRPTTD